MISLKQQYAAQDEAGDRRYKGSAGDKTDSGFTVSPGFDLSLDCPRELFQIGCEIADQARLLDVSVFQLFDPLDQGRLGLALFSFVVGFAIPASSRRVYIIRLVLMPSRDTASVLFRRDQLAINRYIFRRYDICPEPLCQ